MLIDGTAEAGEIAESMLNWDVSNGVNRRAWSGHAGAINTITKTQAQVSSDSEFFPCFGSSP